MPFDFEKPQPLQVAIDSVSQRTPIGTALGSGQIAQLPGELREQALFSAKVESVRALQNVKDGLVKMLSLARDEKARVAAGPGERNENQPGAFQMDRGKFIAENQKLAIALGLRTSDPDKKGSVQDYGSERRLKLIYEMQMGLAQGKAFYLQGQDPDLLDAWPAQELLRVSARKKRRDWKRRWGAAGGPPSADGRMIALKTDPVWVKLSRFGRPYPPFDYNSGMGVQEIDREAAEARGLIKPGEKLTPSVQRDAPAPASAAGLDPEMRQALQSRFGNELEITADEIRWKGTGDTPPQKPFEPHDETPDNGSNENHDENPRSEDGPARGDTTELRRIGDIAKNVFSEVFEGWNAEDRRDVAAAVEAQVAASCLGRKPLYFDPWGEDEAWELSERLREALPAAAKVRAAGPNLYIYRTEFVRPILDGDPAFYRPAGEDDFNAIHRVSARGENGELLGYGARSMSAGDVRVIIHAAGNVQRVFAGFIANAETAEHFAARRMNEIADYTGETLAFTVIPIP